MKRVVFEKWQIKKLLAWFLGFVIIGGGYICYTTYTLYKDKSAEEYYWQKNMLEREAEAIGAQQVGANLLPDALEIGLLEYVNAWGIFTVIAGALTIININRIRNKHGDNQFAALFGRVMSFTLMFIVILGHILMPLSALCSGSCCARTARFKNEYHKEKLTWKSPFKESAN